MRDHLASPQLIIMGRLTYEALAQFVPSASDEVSTRMNALPKLVFSSTLEEPLAWKNTCLANRTVADEIKALKQGRGDLLRSIGSISLVKSMMQLGLVDRLGLMLFPLILGGAGREPICAGYPQASLELLNTRFLDSRIVLLKYRPVRPTASYHPSCRTHFQTTFLASPPLLR